MNVGIVNGNLYLKPETKDEAKILVLVEGSTAVMSGFEAGNRLYLRPSKLRLKVAEKSH